MIAQKSYMTYVTGQLTIVMSKYKLLTLNQSKGCLVTSRKRTSEEVLIHSKAS